MQTRILSLVSLCEPALAECQQSLNVFEDLAVSRAPVVKSGRLDQLPFAEIVVCFLSYFLKNYPLIKIIHHK